MLYPLSYGGVSAALCARRRVEPYQLIQGVHERVLWGRPEGHRLAAAPVLPGSGSLLVGCAVRSSPALLPAVLWSPFVPARASLNLPPGIQCRHWGSWSPVLPPTSRQPVAPPSPQQFAFVPSTRNSIVPSAPADPRTTESRAPAAVTPTPAPTPVPRAGQKWGKAGRGGRCRPTLELCQARRVGCLLWTTTRSSGS